MGYVSLNSPLLSSTDNDGILCGVLNTAKQLLENNVLSLSTQGNTNRWGYFMLNPMALKKITNYVELGKIKPIIHEEFKMSDVPEAFQKLEDGGLRGKIVIDMNYE